MTKGLLAAVGLLLAASVAGCSGDQATPSADPAPSVSESPPESPADSPSESPSESPSGSAGPFSPAPAAPEVAASDACAEVRAGVTAFNNGELDETVARFQAAVPLAEEQADGSPASDELIEAVRWYAALPAEDYPEAFQTSPVFARYQAITLSQCVGAAPGSTEPPEGTEV